MTRILDSGLISSGSPVFPSAVPPHTCCTPGSSQYSVFVACLIRCHPRFFSPKRYAAAEARQAARNKQPLTAEMNGAIEAFFPGEQYAAARDELVAMPISVVDAILVTGHALVAELRQLEEQLKIDAGAPLDARRHTTSSGTAESDDPTAGAVEFETVKLLQAICEGTALLLSPSLSLSPPLLFPAGLDRTPRPLLCVYVCVCACGVWGAVSLFHTAAPMCEVVALCLVALCLVDTRHFLHLFPVPCAEERLLRQPTIRWWPARVSSRRPGTCDVRRGPRRNRQAA